MSLVTFAIFIARTCDRWELDDEFRRQEIGILAGNARFADSRATIAEKAAQGQFECVPEMRVAILSQPSPAVSPRPSTIGNVNIGFSVK